MLSVEWLYGVSKEPNAPIFNVSSPNRSPLLSWDAWSLGIMALLFSEISRISTQTPESHVASVENSYLTRRGSWLL